MTIDTSDWDEGLIDIYNAYVAHVSEASDQTLQQTIEKFEQAIGNASNSQDYSYDQAVLDIARQELAKRQCE